MSSSPSLFLDCETNISVNIFIPIQYFKHLNLISSQSSGLHMLEHLLHYFAASNVSVLCVCEFDPGGVAWY